jgi:uncharacterized protein (DUF2141 family)
MKLSLLALLSAAGALTTACVNIEAKAQPSDLTVEISGLHGYKGKAVLVLWPGQSEASKFPDPSKIQSRDEHDADIPCDFAKYAICSRKIESLQNLTVSYTFKSVPAGDYAVFVFHDENNNGIFDTGLMQRPLEARGFSNVLPEEIKPLARRVPFIRAKFKLDGPKTITIGLKYPPRF